MRIVNANHNYPAPFRRFAGEQNYQRTDLPPLTSHVDSYSRSEAALVGLADGLKNGLILDAAFMGIPVIVGYKMAGASGALIGGLVLPLLLGTIQGLNGFVYPQNYLRPGE